MDAIFACSIVNLLIFECTALEPALEEQLHQNLKPVVGQDQKNPVEGKDQENPVEGEDWENPLKFPQDEIANKILTRIP